MSHLSTVIARVKIAEDVASINGMDKFHQIRFLAGKLINLVEYMTHWDDYDEEEAKEAVRLLAAYDIDPNMDERTTEGYLTALYGEPSLWSRMCVTCGKALSNPLSVERGQGPVCRRKTRRIVSSSDIQEMIKAERVKSSTEDRENKGVGE